MKQCEYQPSYGELAVLGEMFEKEAVARGINFPTEEQRDGALTDFVQQYIDDQDKDPHINCLEDVTCEKEVEDILDWEEVYS